MGHPRKRDQEKARAVAEATMTEARTAANLSHEYEAPVQTAIEGKS